ncbi:MAG: deiodinase-like protein, partial [Nitrososphaerota archaeon]
FEAYTLDGYMVRLSDLMGRRHVVLEFGCITCPPFILSIKHGQHSFSELWRRYSSLGFEFFIVYTNEAHPGEEVRPLRSYEEKLEHAQMLRDDEHVEIPILVDGLSGQLHLSYGGLPNSCFVIDKNGMLIYKSQWADMDELEKVLNTVIRYEEALMEGGRIIEFNYSEKLVYRDLEMRLDYETVRRVRREVLERAGRKAVDELERSLNYKS